MSKVSQIFQIVNKRPEFQYTNAQISKWSNLNSGEISRFLNGTVNVSADKFIRIVESLPKEFRTAYLQELFDFDYQSSKKVDLKLLILKASYEDMIDIIDVVTDRCKEVFTKGFTKGTDSEQKLLE